MHDKKHYPRVYTSTEYYLSPLLRVGMPEGGHQYFCWRPGNSILQQIAENPVHVRCRRQGQDDLQQRCTLLYRVWSSRHVQENLLLAYLSRHFVEYSDTFHRTPIKASPQCEAALAQAVDLYSRGKSPGSFVHSRIIPRSSPASDSYLVEPLQHLHGSAGTSRPAQHVSDTGSIATEVLFATCWLVKPSE